MIIIIMHVLLLASHLERAIRTFNKLSVFVVCYQLISRMCEPFTHGWPSMPPACGLPRPTTSQHIDVCSSMMTLTVHYHMDSLLGDRVQITNRNTAHRQYTSTTSVMVSTSETYLC